MFLSILSSLILKITQTLILPRIFTLFLQLMNVNTSCVSNVLFRGTIGSAGLTLHTILLYSPGFFGFFFHIETSVGRGKYLNASYWKKNKNQSWFQTYIWQKEKLQGGRKFFLLVTVLLLNTWMCTYGVSTCTGTPYRESIHRPYVHYFRSFVFSCIFIKPLTELF